MAEKEARLIDANIFIRDLTAMKSMYDAIALDGMIKALKEAPTIDPESLRPHGKLRLEITIDDFEDNVLAHIRGWHKRHYYCPFCNQELKRELYEKEKCFGSQSAVNAEVPMNFCPNCGAKMDKED